ncbi:MAG: TonB-dependent receptor [Pseudomonadota bacterium]|nr:TonB-dependent receptor [Pseudomonadota bacterium]
MLLSPGAYAVSVDEVVVSASGIPTKIDQTGSSISVLDEEDFLNYQERHLQNVLQRVSGVSTYSSGGPGTSSNVFLRGLTGKYSVVQLDGIQLNSPVSQQAEWAHITTLGLERVEVLRGSHGVLYGSEAVGGVVSMFTAYGGPTRQSLSLEAGNYDSYSASGFAAGSLSRLDYGVALNLSESNGFSAADEDDGNSEDDGYEYISAVGRFGLALSDNLDLNLSVRYVDSDVDNDNYVPVDSNDTTTFESLNAKLGLTYQVDNLRHEVSLVTSKDENKSVSAFSTLSTEGTREMFIYLGQFTLSEANQFLFGLEMETEEYDDGLETYEVDNQSAHILWQTSLISDLFMTFAARIDDQEEFGRHETGRVTVLKELTPEFKLSANYGTGFRSPSLYEQYGRSIFCQDGLCGNVNLEPEESVSEDIGIIYDNGDGVFLSASIFKITLDNLIGYSNGKYIQQPGESTYEGVELTADWALGDRVNIDANYTYQDPKLSNGRREIRRPRHSFNMNIKANLSDKVTSNLSILSVRDVIDTNFNAFPYAQVDLDDYNLVNFGAHYKINDYSKIQGKITNLLDEDYQTALGYGSSDRSLKVGVLFDF